MFYGSLSYSAAVRPCSPKKQIRAFRSVGTFQCVRTSSVRSFCQLRRSLSVYLPQARFLPRFIGRRKERWPTHSSIIYYYSIDKTKNQLLGEKNYKNLLEADNRKPAYYRLCGGRSAEKHMKKPPRRFLISGRSLFNMLCEKRNMNYLSQSILPAATVSTP